MNGEKLYRSIRLGQINKNQLTDNQKGELYKYMIESNKITENQVKPEVIKKYNLVDIPKNKPITQETSTPTYIPSRSPDTNAPINMPTYTPTFGNNFKPINKSTNPEMELVDLLSNLTLDRGRTHERQQGGAYTPKPIIQSTPTDLTLGDRVEQGIKGIGYNWAGGNLSSIGTIASIGSDIEVNHRPESSFISPKDFYPNNPEYKDNRIAETLQLADKLLAKGSEHTAKGREGLGTAGGVAYDILTGAGQMGADIGTAAVTGVGMLPILGARVFGQGASEARQSGADINQQIAYGVISAGIEIATEKLVGGVPFAEKLGMGGVADEALHNGAIKLAKMIKGSPRLAKAFVYLVNMGGEGVEEMIAEFLSPFAKRLTYDPNADLAELEEIAYSGLLGAGISGIMGGGVIGNPEVDFNISEIYNPTPKYEFDINNYQYNPNNSVYPQQPKQTIKVEQNINGIQDTLSQGLNQIYNALDNGQKDEQSINTMITNLERVKKLVPTLSNYVDSQIEKLNNYKVIEQPQANEINEVEQSIEQDANVAQISDNEVTEDIQTLIKQGSYEYNGLPVKYNSKLKGEARNHTTYIEVGDKFFNLDSNQQINVLNHEVAHNNDLFDGKKFIEVMDGGIFGKPVTRRDGSVTWEGIFGDIGSNAVEETYTEALKVFRDDPEWLKEKHPKVYEYFTGERIVDDNKIDNIISIEELKQQEVLQDSNEIVANTKQINKDNVTSIKEEKTVDKTIPKFSQKLYQGKGRTREEIYLSSAKYPVLGEGQYYTFNKNDAQNYGDNITESNIDLNNPLEIFDDMQWRELTQEAGWEFPNPFAHDEESAKVAIANIKKLKQIVIDKGYDGIIIQFDKTRSGDTSTVTGNSIRTLDKVFGHDQVVSYVTEQPTTNETIPTKQIVEEDKTSVKTSIKDNKGNVLSKEQQEILKDSKIRDKDSNIKLIYHGGIVEGDFDTTRGTKSTQYGAGAYFTDAYGIAEEWAIENKGSITEGYININKPFDDRKWGNIEKNQEYNNFIKLLQDEGLSQTEINSIFDDSKDTPFTVLRKVLFKKTGEKPNFDWNGADLANQLLRKAGYDGIISDIYDSEQYVIFNPDQIIRRNTTTKQTNVVENETTETKYTAAEEMAIDNFANKLFNSYLLDNKIDRNTLTENQINNAIESRKEQARELVDAIHGKNFDVLTDRLHRGNILSLKLFTEVTGLPTNTQKNTDANIRSLDPEAYHKWTKKQSEIRKQAEEQNKIEKQKAKEEAKQAELIELENKRISTHYGSMTLKEFAQRLEKDGYRYVELNTYGAFELNNGDKRIDGKKITDKEERQYLRDYFRVLAKNEQEADALQEQEEYEALSEEDKEAIEGLFTKKPKENDKISVTNIEKEGIIETKGDVENGENEISIDEDRIDVPESPTDVPTEEIQATTRQQGVGETSLPEAGGIEGVRGGTDGTGNDIRTELGNDNARDTDDTTREGTRKQSTKDKPKDVSVTSNPKGNDYIINGQEDVVTDTDKKTRYKNNVDAINLMKQIESENRHATPEEQKILARYAGWGGLSEAFATDSRYDWDKREYVSSPKKGWEKEHNELKEMLTEEEYRRANDTVTDAFYTPISVIQGIYEGLKHFGFEGGRVIEPAFGIGNFIGAMPADVRSNSRIVTGIEVDGITGRIAKLLYPNSDIRVQGFEKAKLPDGYYDVAISNVPFGQTNINDTRYSDSITKSIHNYFFAKALDVVRPGGIVMFITSSKTMDSKDTAGIRAYIKGKADLIGAVRLPNTTFKDSSLTEVVSDLIILKVRESGTAYKGEPFLEMKNFKIKNDGYTQQAPMNEYYLKHPDHLLGEPTYDWDYTSRGNVISVRGDGRDLGQSITETLLKMQGSIYEESDTKVEIRERTEKAVKEASKNTKEGSYEVVNGKLTINRDGKLVEVDKTINKTELDKVTKLIEIKNVARDLLNAQRDNETDLKIDALRKKLNRLYDSYVKKNGFLNNKKNVKLLYDDPDVSFLLSLEEYTKPKKADKNLGYAAVKESAIKSDIFTKNTIATIKKIAKADSAKEALVVSLNEKGQVDINYISKLTGKTELEIIKELVGHIYKNPITQKYETADMYLSGNVKYKLREAEARAIHEPEYNSNVEALKAVQPKDKESWEISIKVGSSLVSADVYEDFTKHLLGRFSDIEVYQTQHSGEWHVRERDEVRKSNSVKSSIENRSKWGIDVTGFTAINLLEKIMNNKSIIVNRTIKNSDGSTTKVNMPEETALAQEKAELIKAEFDKWLQEHNKGETLKNVTQYYNDTFNTDVLREFDGSHLPDTLENMNSSIKLTKHQKDAVWRIISGGGNSLLAHEVGAGKTFSMIAASMEMKRLGIIKKPMFVVPNNIYEQWGIEFRRLYPGSKILIPDADDFSKKNRHILLNKIATGTYDAVIVPESQFTMITASEEYTTEFFNEKLQELEQALEIAKAEGQKLSESKIRQKIKNFETKLEKRLESINKDKGIVVFEELGIDSLFVDEAHRFKNLMYQTGLQVSGLGTPDGSDKSFDLLMKVRYLQKLNGGKGITFATATPILNSLTEVYNWQQYLAPDQLRAKNIYSFDAWASIFAKIESVAEVKPEGTGYRVKNGISKITNVGMLAKMFREFTDFKTQEMLNLPRPEIKTGKYITISVPKTAWLENYMAELAQRAEAVRKGQVKPEVDNMLKITSDGRKAALDPRLVDPLFEKGEGEATKIDIAVDHLFEQWSKTKKDKLTHLVFVEFSTPKGKDTKKIDNEFDIDDNVETDTGLDSFYNDIKRRLVAKGIPEKEIAFIHDAKNADQKIALKNRFNSGEIRILIGNNEKMGVGIDLQKRTKTITHIDYPWRPKDLQQEDGRGLRQGNMNKEMELYVIVSEGSFDARLWDNLQRKSKLVDDMLTADLDAVEIEDIGIQTLSAQEVVGIASGNPLMQEQIVVSQKANKLRNLEKGYKKEKANNLKNVIAHEQTIAYFKSLCETIENLVKKRKDTFGENFKITINGESFTDYKEADKYILKLKTKNRQQIKEESKMVFDADFAGIVNKVELVAKFSADEQFTINTNFLVENGYEFNTSDTKLLEEHIKNIGSKLEKYQGIIADEQKSIDSLKKEIEKAFPYSDELRQTVLREQELMRILNPEQVLNEEATDEETEQPTSKASKGGVSFTGSPNKPIVDMSRPLRKPTEIRKDITKKFGVPTTSKKFNRSKKFLGYYKVIPEVIRLRYDNDIGTVMHELGHHFDKKYGFNKLNKQLITDMINKMNPAFKNNYQKSELPGEAIAEFLRYYTTDPTTAEQFAGDFYELFEQTLSKEDLKNIQEIRSDVLRWVNAEQKEKAMSTNIPLTEQTKANSKKKIEEATTFEKYNTILFSEYAAIERFTKTVESLTGRKLRESLNPYVLVEATYQNDGLINGLMTGQLRNAKSEPIKTDDNLGKIIDDANNDIREFEHYLKLKRAAHLLETKNHKFYADDIYSGVDDMQQNLNLLEQEYPKFVELSERLYDWYNKFFKAWVIDTKMLGKDSEKVYKEMRKQDPYYVPLFRVKENGGVKGFTNSIADQKAEVYRLSEKGNDQDTTSPLDNITMQVARIVNSYTKNNVLRAITNQYNTVDGLGMFLDRVPPDMVRQLVSTENVKIMLEENFSDVSDIDDIIQSIPDMIQGYKTSAKSKEVDVIGVIAEDGSKQFYQVFDKPLLDSLTRMNPIQLDAYVKMIGKMTRFTTGLTTGLNPIFGITSNAWRDFVQAWILGSHKDPATYMLDYVKSIYSVMAGTEKYKRFKELGGVYGSSITSELRNEKKARNDIIRRLHKYRKGQKISAKNAISLVAELILDFNDAIETAPRLSEFNKAYSIAKKKKGYTEQDALMYAMKKAKNVTLHFARRGTAKSELPGQAIPYLGAGLQGMDRLRRGLFTKEEAPQVWVKSITTLTLGTILLWMAHRDDEDYENLTDGIKDNYWILWKNPDGSFARIPKPKDLAAIFSSSAERTLNAFFKEEGAGAFEGWETTLMDALLPPISTVFRPIFDVWKNEKWSGGKIIPMAMDYLPKTEQYDETTSRIGVELAQLVSKIAPGNVFASPKNVDYLLDQYYGGLADILLPITTPTTYVDVDTLKEKYDYLAMPMAAIMKTGELIGRKFKADPSYSNDAVNDFYDLRDKTIKANNAYEKRGVMSNDVDLIAETNFKAYYKSISSMWKTIDTIDSFANKTLPDEYKESFKKLINQSRFADSEKKKVLNDLKDGKLNRESVTMLQKTVRDEIVKLADKAVKEYKANHKKNNEVLK